MVVLGSGTSNGGCSILHAAGLGYGASLALDLPVKVRLLDKKPRRELDDPDGLLEQILAIRLYQLEPKAPLLRICTLFSNIFL